jgi:hypothetical protein
LLLITPFGLQVFLVFCTFIQRFGIQRVFRVLSLPRGVAAFISIRPWRTAAAATIADFESPATRAHPPRPPFGGEKYQKKSCMAILRLVEVEYLPSLL